MDKKSFVDPIRTLTLAQLKQEQADRSRTPTGKDVHLHRHYLDPHSKARLANTQVIFTFCENLIDNRSINLINQLNPK